MFSTRSTTREFYGRIRIPRISGNFGACTDSVYQVLLSAQESLGSRLAPDPLETTVFYHSIDSSWPLPNE